jgi:phosphate acyltransferase
VSTIKGFNAKNSSKEWVIGIDLTGAEITAHEILSAVISSLKKLPLRVLFFCIPDCKKGIEQIRDAFSNAKVAFEECSEVVSMYDTSMMALKKLNSPLVRGIIALQEKSIDAFITCGNTAALTAIALHYLEPLPGIKRPALLTHIRLAKSITVLDIGATLVHKADQLIQHAFLGAAYAGFSEDKPKIALLNIGAESVKGTKELQKAWRVLHENRAFLPFSFEGNIEAKELFLSEIDVVVTSGFVGNIFLKAAEGVTGYFLEMIEKKEIPGSLLSIDSKNAIQQFFFQKKEQGAFLAGVNRLIIKCHSATSQTAIQQAVQSAYESLNNKLMERVSSYLAKEQQHIEKLRAQAS